MCFCGLDHRISRGKRSNCEYLGSHMWLMGCPNPCKLEQKLECTFLKPFIQVKIKWASKEISIYAIQSYQLHSKADSAHQGWIGLTAWLVTLNGIGEKFFWCSSWFYMGKRFQKNALPFLFQFARVRAAHQLLVLERRYLNILFP